MKTRNDRDIELTDVNWYEPILLARLNKWSNLIWKHNNIISDEVRRAIQNNSYNINKTQ